MKGMNMTRFFSSLSLLAMVLAASVPADPATAQQDQREPKADRNRQERGRRAQDMQRRGPAQGVRQRGQQAQRSPLQPLGWVRVAVDYDQDDRFDAMETIYYYDLVQARDRSAQRRGQQARQGRQDPFARSEPRQRQALRRISGQVADLRAIRLTGGDQQHIAKVQTHNGQTVPVLLGSAEQLSQLELQNGDQITVWGTGARINDRPVFAARRIQSGEQRVTVSTQPGRNLRRVRGQIASLRTTTFRGRDQQFQVARVELEGGPDRTVILGPQSRLEDLNLQQGDQVQLLARPGRLNDQPALIAQQIRAKDRTVQIEQPEGRRITSRR
jgi:hypothetical protein